MPGAIQAPLFSMTKTPLCVKKCEKIETKVVKNQNKFGKVKKIIAETAKNFIVLVDTAQHSVYNDSNRTRHASQRCAPRRVI